MADQNQTEQNQAEPKRRPVFRNASQRIYHLRKRPHQAQSETSFPVGPGETVEPLDDAEQKLLSGIDEFRDVEKETPALGNQISQLQAKLDTALKENAQLKSESASSQAQRTGKQR